MRCRYSLVILTSALGAYTAHKLGREGRVEPTHGRLLLLVYIAKLATAFPPAVQSAPSALFLLITITPLWWARDLLAPPISALRGVAHALFIAVALLVAQQPLLLRLFSMATQQHEEKKVAPYLFGLSLVLYGVACAPLSYRFFVDQPMLQSLNGIGIAVGGACLVLQPNLSLSPATMLENSSTWALILAVVLLVCTLGGVISVPQLFGYKLLFASSIGGSLGWALASRFLAPVLPLRVVIVGALQLVAVFITFLAVPSPSSHVFVPLVFVAVLSTLPVSYGLAALLIDDVNSRADNCAAIAALFAALMLLIAFFLKSQFLSPDEAAVVADARKHKPAVVAPLSIRSGFQAAQWTWLAAVSSHREQKGFGARALGLG